jgi:hypothetical protein
VDLNLFDGRQYFGIKAMSPLNGETSASTAAACIQELMQPVLQQLPEVKTVEMFDVTLKGCFVHHLKNAPEKIAGVRSSVRNKGHWDVYL